MPTLFNYVLVVAGVIGMLIVFAVAFVMLDVYGGDED